MDEAKENLRKILCPDSILDEATKILRRLDELEDTKEKFFYYLEDIFNEEENIPKIRDDARLKFPILYALIESGLVSESIFTTRFGYCISEEGKRIYERLSGEERETFEKREKGDFSSYWQRL